MGRGLLHLTILTANDLAKHERFGKQPCYVSIQLGNRTARSKTCKAGNGQAPAWNETLFIQLEKEQEVVFEVFVERLLMKDINIGSATLSLDRVLQHGTDDAELRLIHKGTQQGTLSISLELRRTGSQGTKLRSGSSSSSLASPASSASLAMTHSGSFGSSFTGIPGLKPSSLPVMLLQQPNLALYREQLLQQSAMLTAQAQQQQQQQQQQRLQQGRQPSGAGPSSSTGGGAGPSKTTSWAPKRTVADLFADPANMDDITSRDIIGMLGATDSNFSGFDSVSGPLPTAGGAVDALRVQALVDAVYGGSAASAAHANTAQVTATSQSSAAGANTASVTDGMGGGASSLCPPLAGNLGGGRGATGSSTVAGQAAAGEGPSGGQTRLMTSSLPPRPSRGMKPPPDGNFDPFQAAAFHAAAAAAAAGLGPPSPPPFGNTGGSSSSTAQAGTSAAAAARGAGAGLRSPAGAGDLPQAFNMAALQAAAAAFAGAANTGSAGNDSDEQSDGEADAFLVGVRPAAAARAAAAGTATAGAWGDMPDPFGAGAAGAAAAAAAATGSAAAAGVLLAGASSSSSSNRPDAQQGLARSSRRAAAGPALHTVAEGYEPPGQPEDVFGAAWAVAAAAAAGVGAAEHPTDQVAQHLLNQQPQDLSPAAAGSSAAAAGSSRQPQGGLGTAATADDSSDLRSLLLQTNKQLALLTKQLQERDVLVQQLQEQLQETQRDLQVLRKK